MKHKSDDADDVELQKTETKVYMDMRLFKIATEDCQRRGVYLSDLVAELLADYYEMPELATVPRQRVGPKLGMKMPKSKKK